MSCDAGLIFTRTPWNPARSYSHMRKDYQPDGVWHDEIVELIQERLETDAQRIAHLKERVEHFVNVGKSLAYMNGLLCAALLLALIFWQSSSGRTLGAKAYSAAGETSAKSFPAVTADAPIGCPKSRRTGSGKSYVRDFRRYHSNGGSGYAQIGDCREALHGN